MSSSPFGQMMSAQAPPFATPYAADPSVHTQAPRCGREARWSDATSLSRFVGGAGGWAVPMPRRRATGGPGPTAVPAAGLVDLLGGGTPVACQTSSPTVLQPVTVLRRRRTLTSAAHLSGSSSGKVWALAKSRAARVRRRSATAPPLRPKRRSRSSVTPSSFS